MGNTIHRSRWNLAWKSTTRLLLHAEFGPDQWTGMEAPKIHDVIKLAFSRLAGLTRCTDHHEILHGRAHYSSCAKFHADWWHRVHIRLPKTFYSRSNLQFLATRGWRDVLIKITKVDKQLIQRIVQCFNAWAKRYDFRQVLVLLQSNLSSSWPQLCPVRRERGHHIIEIVPCSTQWRSVGGGALAAGLVTESWNVAAKNMKPIPGANRLATPLVIHRVTAT